MDPSPFPLPAQMLLQLIYFQSAPSHALRKQHQTPRVQRHGLRRLCVVQRPRRHCQPGALTQQRVAAVLHHRGETGKLAPSAQLTLEAIIPIAPPPSHMYKS